MFTWRRHMTIPFLRSRQSANQASKWSKACTNSTPLSTCSCEMNVDVKTDEETARHVMIHLLYTRQLLTKRAQNAIDSRLHLWDFCQSLVSAYGAPQNTHEDLRRVRDTPSFHIEKYCRKLDWSNQQCDLVVIMKIDHGANSLISCT